MQPCLTQWQSLVLAACLGGATAGLAQNTTNNPAAAGAATVQPYSADEQIEQWQTQSDGSHKSTLLSQARIYRDHLGRTRREVALKDPATGSSNRTVVTIVDGVAGVSYELDTATMVAYREPLVHPKPGHGGEGEPHEGGGFGEGGHGGEGEHHDGGGFGEGGHSGEGEHHDGGGFGEGGHGGEGEHHDGGGFGEGGHGGEREHPNGGRGGGQRKHEDLGIQTIANRQAHGSRNTMLLKPAANGGAASIVDERWVAVDLGIAVKSIHTDPRTGQTVRTLANVREQEPPAELFQVPAGYTVKTAQENP